MNKLGEIKESTTSSFVFKAETGVRKHDYVRAGEVLAQVWEIKQQSSGTFAHANVIGSINRRYMPREPFDLGSPVIQADELFVKKILGISDKGIYLGLLKDTSIRVHLSPEIIIQKHLCVLAKSGSGKSYSVGVVIEEFIKQGIPIVIIDPHGEYVSLRRPNLDQQELAVMQRFGVKPHGYANQIFEFSPTCSNNREAIPLFLDETNLSFQELINLFPNATPLQKGVIYEAHSLALTKKFFLLKDILDGIKDSKNNARWSLVPQIEQVLDMKLFSVNYTPLAEIVQKGRCSLINLRGVPPYIQELLVALLLARIFEGRKNETLPPVLIVVEEAHRYAPEKGQGKSYAGGIIRTIATEGRKFGVGLAIISQRPARVDKNVLSQCNTHITLKTTNPNDLKAITASVEGLDMRAADEIQMLPIGTSIVAGLPFAAPIFTEIRPRETLHGGKLLQL